VVAVSGEGGMRVSPDPTESLAATDELLLIGSVDAELAFMEKYPQA
jgi:K+/H+ antiporter YhaU regulatory subunit KhtT